MTRLELSFLSTDYSQLESTVFYHPWLIEPARAIRGKTAGAFLCWGSFQWTAAVKALMILLLRAKVYDNGLDSLLCGGSGSPAASLDYAIDKQPAWIFEMFGSDSKGKSILSHLVLRTNPGRKRGGIVCLRLNVARLKPQDIWCTCNGQTSAGKREVLELLTRLDNHGSVDEVQEAAKPV